MTLREIGNRTIEKPLNQEFFYKDGDTTDIITKVLKVYGERNSQLQNTAAYLKGKTLTDTCRNVYRMVKENIRYRVDPKGEQWVRRPAQMWWTGVGDCKSYSVFIASLLTHLGIVGAFRFVSYNDDPTPTHVYVVVVNNGKEIILDAVMPAFNQEQPYQKKYDYSMTRISELAGLPKGTVYYYGKDQLSGGLSTALNKGKRREVLNAALPGLAMLALYQFIPSGNVNGDLGKEIRVQFSTPDNLLEKMPDVVKSKRLTSFQSFWDFGDWADIKVENDVYPKLKAYLTQSLGMDPADWWRRVMQACSNSNTRIGVIDFATASAAVSSATNIIEKVKNVIGNMFGGSDIRWERGDPSTWSPAASDWKGWGCSPLGYLSVGTGAPNTSGALSWNDIINSNPPANTNPTTGQPYTPPPANTTQLPPTPDTAAGKDNTMLYVLGAVGLFLAFKN
jgi:hypothetical protein